MASNAEPLKITFPYYVDHIPRRSRKIRTSWVWGSQNVVIRSGSRSEMQLAFSITRRSESDDHVVIDVYADEYGLWWPIGCGDSSDIRQFFGALELGYSEALGLTGVGFHVPYKRIAKDLGELEIRDTKYSSLDDMIARTQIAAQNIRIVDNQRVYIRGGDPVYVFYSSREKPGKLLAGVCNSGFEFGRPVPALIPADGRFYWLDQMNFKRFIEVGSFCTTDTLAEFRESRETELIQLAQVQNRRPGQSALDPTELELQVLCRDLIDRLDQKLNMSPGLFRNLRLFELGIHGKPTAAECAAALIDFRGWRSALEEILWFKFRGEERLVRQRIAVIENRCRHFGRPSPFTSRLEADDDEALGSLSI